MKRKSIIALFLLLSFIVPTSCELFESDSYDYNNNDPVTSTNIVTAPAEPVQSYGYAPGTHDFSYETKQSYMIYYGILNDDIIEEAKQYEVVILHPKMGNITREQVQEIRKSGTKVLGYISIGEDLRTAYMTPEEMLKDSRFTGDKTGPRVDPRPEGTLSLDGVDPMGNPSSAGTGYASYYLDDNNHDGKPDINPIFNCAFTNIGDPAWFEVLDNMTMDGEDQIPGLKEILSDDYGRALGCDGVFLDTIDTVAPNSYTDETSYNMTRFEWTATGVKDFCALLKNNYPDKLILQNRGVFFYNPALPHYKYNPREYVDYVMYESYHLDSNSDVLFYEGYSADNRYNFAPRLVAEASRLDGFQVLSLGYAEGPEEYHLKDTLFNNSEDGLEVLLEDMNIAEEAGFMHYITDGSVTMVNDFVIDHEETEDSAPPLWTSTYNDSLVFPPKPPTPRIGIQEAVPVKGGVTVRWDVAMDKNHVKYMLYYQTEPFDFENDPSLSSALCKELVPEVGDGYENGVGENVYPNQDTLTGLTSGETYYFLIRARDLSENANEEDNTVYLSAIPQ